MTQFPFLLIDIKPVTCQYISHDGYPGTDVTTGHKDYV